MITRAESVHPHIRGAYGYSNRVWKCPFGSSPHTWGIHPCNLHCQQSARFIPTYVGHTRKVLCGKALLPVHPHIRGAYLHFNWFAGIRYGSSPHTWGIPKADAENLKTQRFIPTYVGHTFSLPRRKWAWTVHPHIRGAYKGLPVSLAPSNGSSPHTWGIRGMVPELRHQNRFIPTYVGHTHRKCSLCILLPVHPHIRGAYTGPP